METTPGTKSMHGPDVMTYANDKMIYQNARVSKEKNPVEERCSNLIAKLPEKALNIFLSCL